MMPSISEDQPLLVIDRTTRDTGTVNNQKKIYKKIFSYSFFFISFFAITIGLCAASDGLKRQRMLGSNESADYDQEIQTNEREERTRFEGEVELNANSNNAASSRATDSDLDDLDQSSLKMERTMVEPELKFHTEEEIVSVVSRAIEGATENQEKEEQMKRAKKDKEKDEMIMNQISFLERRERRRGDDYAESETTGKAEKDLMTNNDNNNNNAFFLTTSTGGDETALGEKMMSSIGSLLPGVVGGSSSGSSSGGSGSSSSSSSESASAAGGTTPTATPTTSSTITTLEQKEQAKEQTLEQQEEEEEEAEELSQAEEASRGWDLTTYLNVQENSEKAVGSFVALIVSVGGEESELEKYVKVVEPIDPSQWPLNIDRAMYALKRIFTLKARAEKAAAKSAKLGKVPRVLLQVEGDKESKKDGSLGYFEMESFVEDALKGKVEEKTNDDDDDDQITQEYDDEEQQGVSSSESSSESSTQSASLGSQQSNTYDEKRVGALGYFDFKNFASDVVGNIPQKRTKNSEEEEEGTSYLGTRTMSEAKLGNLPSPTVMTSSLIMRERRDIPPLGYFDAKNFVNDALFNKAPTKRTRDSDLEEVSNHLDNAATSTAALGLPNTNNERKKEKNTALAKLGLEESEVVKDRISGLEPLGLNSNDVKVLYQAYVKEKEEKNSLLAEREGKLNNLEGATESELGTDISNYGHSWADGITWNLNHLKGLGLFEAMVDRDQETGKLNSKWWQTEKIPQLGKLFSHVYRWQLAADAKVEKALILDIEGLLDTSQLAIPIGAIRVVSAHAANDFDVMFLGNLGTKDPIFETFPDSSGNIIEIRKWQGTQDHANANAYIVSKNFVDKIFEFILSSEESAPQESLETWIAQTVCGAKIIDDARLGFDPDGLVQKPIVGMHMFNCYSATGVQVVTSSSNDSTTTTTTSSSSSATSQIVANTETQAKQSIAADVTFAAD
jgi:hypothetical protein